MPQQTPQQFVQKWSQTTLKERSAAQEHFMDLCQLVGHETPALADPTGEAFAFEAGAGKTSGGQGFADVWKRGHFAWEYKGKHADLDKAYQQLLQYREALENPPLLVVSDIEQIVIHTNFTNTVKQIYTLTFDDLLTPQGIDTLKAIFYEPKRLRARKTIEQATEEAATEFASLAELLRKYGEDPRQTAHFLIRLLFCLFAEDIDLLPNHLFTKLIQRTRRQPAAFTAQLRQLFAAMTAGGWFGVDEIHHFDGGLFDDAAVIELDSAGLEILHHVAALDWSSIEPSILGTLFERSLDPDKRSQLGAHYTSKEDILLIVEPVLMVPFRRRWETVKAEAEQKAEARDQAKSLSARTRAANELQNMLMAFAQELADVRVLDPACGSGNFLYVALKQLLDLEKEVSTFAGQLGAQPFYPTVAPEQLYGIEINPYAHELAQATVWIGYIQWLRDNGFGQPSEPILKPLHNILLMDAILAYDDQGQPVEPEWPEADVVIGNPPFLGDKRMRTELDNRTVNDLRKLYSSRLGGQIDLVCYWFELTRSFVKAGKIKRAGLLATNSIRSGTNRQVLDRIKETGDIFMAWSDRKWILEGAAVRVSIVGFDTGEEIDRMLDGKKVDEIHSDLTSSVDITNALQLSENEGLCFLGMMKAGPFDIDADIAKSMLKAPLNPNGRPNSDVVKPRLGGWDIVRNPRNTWIIDFGTDTAEEVAAMYELPFEYVKKHVKPMRDKNRRKSLREKWWILGEARPGLREAIKNLSRCIVTPEVAKYRVFAWMDTSIIPDHTLHVIARDTGYFFGILQSDIHKIWSLAQGNRMGVGNDPRYNSSRTLSTFPFPWLPGQEPTNDPPVQAIAQAAKELVEKRDNWLNPPGATEKQLKKRTLTNLYNQHPTWLDLAHKKLDEAVFAAYGWPSDLSDEEILERLLALNLARAGAQ